MVELLDLLGIFIDIRRIHIQAVLYVNYGISFKWINKPFTNQLQRNRHWNDPVEKVFNWLCSRPLNFEHSKPFSTDSSKWFRRTKWIDLVTVEFNWNQTGLFTYGFEVRLTAIWMCACTNHILKINEFDALILSQFQNLAPLIIIIVEVW